MGYVARFDRISRNHKVPPLSVSGTAENIASQVYRYAKPKVLSRDLEVVVDLKEMRGTIYCGIAVGGQFTIEELPADDPPEYDPGAEAGRIAGEFADAAADLARDEAREARDG